MKKNKKLELKDPSLLKNEAGVHTSGVAVRDEVLPLSEQGLNLLQTRKRLELETIQSLDRSDITPRKECWFLIDSRWLNQWSAFVQDLDNARTEPGSCPVGASNGDFGVPEGQPGPLSTRDLVEQPAEEEGEEEGGEAADGPADGKEGEHAKCAKSKQAPGATVTPKSSSSGGGKGKGKGKGSFASSTKRPYRLLPGLKQTIDYRGVTPEIYYTFVELYGREKVDPVHNPELTRYVCDVDGIDVEETDLLSIRYGFQVSECIDD